MSVNSHYFSNKNEPLVEMLTYLRWKKAVGCFLALLQSSEDFFFFFNFMVSSCVRVFLALSM